MYCRSKYNIQGIFSSSHKANSKTFLNCSLPVNAELWRRRDSAWSWHRFTRTLTLTLTLILTLGHWHSDIGGTLSLFVGFSFFCFLGHFQGFVSICCEAQYQLKQYATKIVLKKRGWWNLICHDHYDHQRTIWIGFVNGRELGFLNLLWTTYYGTSIL